MTEIDVEETPITKFEYLTFGPFHLGAEDDLSSLLIADDFWDEIEEKYPGLRAAIGVYIFSVKSTKRSSLTPWYVGKTDRGFERRFHQHKTLFSKLLVKTGSTSVFLIPRLKRGSAQFMKQRKKLTSNDVLETVLIERCLELNPMLLNDSKVKYVRGLVVPGFKGAIAGKPKAPAKQLRAMLNGTIPK